MTIKNEDIYQSVDGVAGGTRKEILEDAITYAMGANQWDLLHVVDRGSYLTFDDGTEVFLFDSTPLVKFRRLVVETLGNQSETRTHYQFETLYVK